MDRVNGDLYALLTTPLPLAGAAILARRRGGDESAITAALRAEAPWMAAAINRIADQAAMQLWAGRPWLALRPMLLVGPAGAGKTHFARRLGALSGCGDAILSLAGVSSNAELAGSPRGFRHTQPCFPATAMLRLFRHTRSVRRLRRAIETLVAVSARHVPRTVN